MTVATDLNVAPGSIVLVRDEEWLVTAVDQTSDGQLLHVIGTSELVRGTTASFYPSIDTAATALDPHDAKVIADGSSHYRKARLWLESTIRSTSTPLSDPSLTVARGALADSLPYQISAVEKALDPSRLRTRILLADAVGLGKTLEIGMILSELIRRGRGERILIVCPRHVLEQTQNEMWCRFDIPFVRLDSLGVQRVRQRIPANRNPFTFYKRVIISIDTLKQDRFAHDLRHHHWDAVVIDESHNVTNSSSKNNHLANVLAPNTDALILASATPHNGNPDSFAELIRLLEPTAVSPTGELNKDDLASLVVRRHRNSEEVASVVGGEWAERQPMDNRLIAASPAEDAVAAELADTWLHPASGTSPYTGRTSLFPWTLAKAFLSSPAALSETIASRLNPSGKNNENLPGPAEIRALATLQDLNDAAFDHSAKYDALVGYLRSISIGRRSSERAVVFSERVPTLHWLRRKLIKDLKLADDQVRVLHGGMTDIEQQEVVESFKQSGSPIRVLVTGDVASEGVNLHLQCHQLIHYDIPWSLIRIEQRNGRIDRYGQRHRPQITTLLLEPSTESWTGDVHVLTRLLEKEEQAHKALGDAASLMGEYSVAAEENTIRDVLAHNRDVDAVVQDVDDLAADPHQSLAAFLDMIGSQPGPQADTTPEPEADPLYRTSVDFLSEAVADAYDGNQSQAPGDGGTGGISWQRFSEEHLVRFVPPPDLRTRLEVLPDSYLTQRHVLSSMTLATTRQEADRLLKNSLNDESGSSWPEAHYLGPLHPVLDWAADRCLSALSRNEIFAVRGSVIHPTVLLVGTITNKRGQVISAVWMSVIFDPDEFQPVVDPAPSSAAMLRDVGFGQQLNNPGPVANLGALQELIPQAVRRAGDYLGQVSRATQQDAEQRVQGWNQQVDNWSAQAEQLPLRGSMKRRRVDVERERALIAQMAPDRRLVRPLLVVVPADTPVGTATTQSGDGE
ncbi:RNA polymerase-associated protein rapA [Acidipropionibacterium jensenii]|uniref:RNA polymerase-associated protein rapA n=1 Tax=Acidipropionibacterium jensenii TaxID=1749 RepID=A0A3S4UQZ7_9ACTN|nr:RNA polymerase-associated protein rapA [Acidipropionibacterium jensenii]